LNKITTFLYTRYRNAVASQTAETKEKGVMHLPQVVVICSRIPRPSREDKSVINKKLVCFERSCREDKKKYQQTRPVATKECMSRKVKI
jgi:hypothetical protein